jgi:hypothetical protein
MGDTEKLTNHPQPFQEIPDLIAKLPLSSKTQCRNAKGAKPKLACCFEIWSLVLG